MNDNAKKWVDALRSGEYEQGKEYLCKNDKYCCLGVACALYQQSVGDLIVEEGDEETFYDDRLDLLPNKVVEWLGLASDDGGMKLKNQRTSLVSMNDKGVSFAEIADVIESEPKGLFK